MKKITACCLVLIWTVGLMLSMTSCTPQGVQEENALVVTGEGDSVSVQGSDGNVMSFRTYEGEDGGILMDYFYNGTLICTYDLTGGGEGITATAPSGETYVVDSDIAALEITADSQSVSPLDAGERNLGRIDYYSVSGLSNPNVTVMYGFVDSFSETMHVNSLAGSLYSDVLATMSGLLIEFFIVSAVAIPTAGIAGLAASVLVAMISGTGGTIVAGAIDVALSDTYEAIVLNEELTAYTVAGGRFSAVYDVSVVYAEYDGWMYQESDYYSDEGITPDNWSTASNGEKMWEDTYGANGYPACPGVKSVLFYED